MIETGTRSMNLPLLFMIGDLYTFRKVRHGAGLNGDFIIIGNTDFVQGTVMYVLWE